MLLMSSCVKSEKKQFSFKLWMHFSTPKIFNFSLGTHCTLFKTKDTNRKIRKCSVHRLYIKLFSSIDVYISQFNKEPPHTELWPKIKSKNRKPV